MLSPEMLGIKDEINVFEISAEVIKERERLFDPRADISDEDFEKVFRSLEDIAFQDPHVLANLPILLNSKEHKDRFSNYMKSTLHEMNAKLLDGNGIVFPSQTEEPLGDVSNVFNDYLVIAMTGRKSEFRNGFKKLLSEYIRPKLDLLKDSPFIGNYMRVLAYARVMFPDEFSQGDIADEVLDKFREIIVKNIGKSEYAIAGGYKHNFDFHSSGLLAQLTYYKLASPESFKQSRVFEKAEDIIRLKAEELRDCGISGSAPNDMIKFLKTAEWLSVLCADSVKCSDGGITLVWGDKEDINEAEIPDIPQVRRF